MLQCSNWKCWMIISRTDASPESHHTFYGETISIKTNNRHCTLVCNIDILPKFFAVLCISCTQTPPTAYTSQIEQKQPILMAICRKPTISEFLMFKFTWHINVVDIVYTEKFTLFPCFYCYVAVFMQCMLYVFVSCTLWQTDIATKITFSNRYIKLYKVKLGHKSNCQMIFWNTTMYLLMCKPNKNPSLQTTFKSVGPKPSAVMIVVCGIRLPTS